MEKHVECKYFFTKFGHFYFLFLLYFTCTSIITFWIRIFLFRIKHKKDIQLTVKYPGVVHSIKYKFKVPPF